MATEWVYYILVIAKNKAIGNQLAALVDPDSGGHLTFNDRAGLRPVGSVDTVPSAWFAGIPLRQLGYDIVQAFEQGQLHPTLAERGATQQMIDAGQSVLIVHSGLRSSLETQWAEFIAANNYERVPS